MGFEFRLDIVFCYKCLSLVLGLFVVKVDRAKGRSCSAFASLEVGAHIGVYIVGGLTGFVLEIIEMREQVRSVVFVRLFLRINRGSVFGIVKKLMKEENME